MIIVTQDIVFYMTFVLKKLGVSTRSKRLIFDSNSISNALRSDQIDNKLTLRSNRFMSFVRDVVRSLKSWETIPVQDPKYFSCRFGRCHLAGSENVILL